MSNFEPLPVVATSKISLENLGKHNPHPHWDPTEHNLTSSFMESPRYVHVLSHRNSLVTVFSPDPSCFSLSSSVNRLRWQSGRAVRLIAPSSAVIRRAWGLNSHSLAFAQERKFSERGVEGFVEFGIEKCPANIGMCRITTFRSTTDRIYDGGPIRL